MKLISSRYFLILILTVVCLVCTLPAIAIEWKAPVPVDLSEAEQMYLDQKGYLSLVCDPAWPPFDFIDPAGKHSGISADYLRLFSHRIGVPIRLVSTKSWVESVALAKAGKSDLVSMLNYTPERSLFLDFTTPYYEMRSVIVARKGAPHVNGVAGLIGRSVATVDGYKEEEQLRRDFPLLTLVKAQTSQEALQMVSQGKAYATLITDIEATHLSRAKGLGNLEVIGPTKYLNEHRVGVRKGDEILLSIMQKAVNSISPADRELIRDKWMTVQHEDTSNLTPKLWLLGFLLLVMLGGGFIYWRTR